jgi:PAS domain S-box-containing protein
LLGDHFGYFCKSAVSELPKTDAAIVSGRTQADYMRLRLAAIVDSSDDAIISKDLDGVILTWNRAAQRLFGYSEAEAVGQPITIIIPPELYGEETDILTRLRAGEGIEHFETRRLTRNGRFLDVSATISPMTDDAGKIVGASKILRDITESKRAQAALRENQQRLAREIARAKTMQSISTRMISETSQESLVALILEAAMELMASDAASVQVLAANEETLTLLGSRNLHPESAAFWRRVTAEGSSACGVSLRNGERVLVTDVEACEFMTETADLRELRRSGIRAVQSTPLQSRSGRPLGMLSTHWKVPHGPTEDDFRLFDVLARQAADLIERTRAEDAVRESDKRFRLIANAAPVTIWMADVSKQCTYVNQMWLDVAGQSFDEARGTGWTSNIHPEDIAQCWDTYARASDRQEQFQIEYRLRGRDSEYRWMVASAVPRYDGDGSFAGYIGSAIDVTERRLAEEARATIRQRLADAQEAECARIGRDPHDDIVQRLSLHNIHLHALMRATSMSERDIEEATEEVVNLARDVQALARRLHPPRLDYLGIDGAAKALCRELASQHRVEICFDAEKPPEALSRRSSLCLYRVLQEGLQNAIKHSRAAKVEVSLRRGANSVDLTIRDFGTGFDVEAKQALGLGLAKHERTAGRRERTAYPRVTAGPRHNDSGTRASITRMREELLQRPRVLVADDDAALAKAIARLLSYSCDVVGHVRDAAAAIEAVDRLRPDAVVLDLSLPGDLHGLELCRHIKAIVPDVRVVVFTGNDDAELKELAHEAGASALVWKLNAATELALTIQAVIEGREEARSARFSGPRKAGG